MSPQKIKIFAIVGSTRKKSSNYKILKYISEKINPQFQIEIFEEIDRLPHFNPDLDQETPPQKVTEFRNKISQANGILICTPEYVFSLPGTLKNALEWCVSTTIFSGKRTGLITASASGEMGHEQLLLIMKTVEAKFDNTIQLLIQGIRGKVNDEGKIVNIATEAALASFIHNFENQFLSEL
ncbi:NADPH-dependent FMN reductase [Flavobacterium sp. KACC 22761]|uniref:NADPH-dependent FMN reductase n=1 Tax=Flavobacterium sp. KACC 22761 TaxID=3092665 RepID=UPI002A752706|nr:NADPH-dependent FMN reductase [Flavobacterium sp. KACC 22761]WPO77089.1 NADPH-dependent FMN reductase [Flavobacterium sp. KACC 22761]